MGKFMGAYSRVSLVASLMVLQEGLDWGPTTNQLSIRSNQIPGSRYFVTSKLPSRLIMAKDAILVYFVK